VELETSNLVSTLILARSSLGW